MMNEVETRKYEMLARVKDFGASHAAAFPPGTLAADLFAQIGAAVQQISSYSVAQATGNGAAREGTASRRRALAALRDDLEMMNRTARAMSERVPNVVEKFRLPDSGRAQALLDTARAFAAEAVPLRAEFALHELGDAFFARLEVNIAALEQALSIQRRGRESRIAATAAIAGTLTAGIRAVRRLDSIVRNKFAADPLTLLAWAGASRVQRPSRATRAPQPETAGA